MISDPALSSPSFSLLHYERVLFNAPKNILVGGGEEEQQRLGKGRFNIVSTECGTRLICVVGRSVGRPSVSQSVSRRWPPICRHHIISHCSRVGFLHGSRSLLPKAQHTRQVKQLGRPPPPYASVGGAPLRLIMNGLSIGPLVGHVQNVPRG